MHVESKVRSKRWQNCAGEKRGFFPIITVKPNLTEPLISYID